MSLAQKKGSKIQDILFHKRFLKGKEAQDFAAKYIAKHKLAEIESSLIESVESDFVTDVASETIWSLFES